MCVCVCVCVCVFVGSLGLPQPLNISQAAFQALHKPWGGSDTGDYALGCKCVCVCVCVGIRMSMSFWAVMQVTTTSCLGCKLRKHATRGDARASSDGLPTGLVSEGCRGGT